MASHPVPPSATAVSEAEATEKPLTREQWWALFDELRVAQQPAYAEHGGPVAFLRKERDADSTSA